MNIVRDQILWVERYRPQSVKDCILPKELKAKFEGIVKKGELPNMILAGTPGTGKTSIAQALAYDLKADFIKINASQDGNIDTLRVKIKQYASTVSLTNDGRKIVLLDEADNMNINSLQPALRGGIEEFGKTTGFILTANKKSKVLGALHSRCPIIDFRFPKAERPELAAQFLTRIKEILKIEKVKVEKEEILVQLITKYFPDFRRTIGELQINSSSGTISLGSLSNLQDINTTQLVSALKVKDFTKVRSWIVQNLDVDADVIFRSIYDALYTTMKPGSIPDAICLLAEYQYKAAFVADQEINLAACLIQLMVDAEWK